MPRPAENASDWSDLDLLTVEEATERLTAEIAATTEELTGLPDGPERSAAQHRLGLLAKAKERAARGASRPLYGEQT
ncbi:MAG TPA: hypothetical protein VGJ14_03900 [Sporichthyaceae bacterium]|jgi:hypothetical protein